MSAEQQVQKYLDTLRIHAKGMSPITAIADANRLGLQSLGELAANLGISVRILEATHPDAVRMQEEVEALFGDKHN